jgi:predicted Fe-S protein YdhL (DUF1289 family)
MIASPCINICAMNPQTGLCAGCYRTIDEIAAWARLDDPGRLEVLAAVTRRRQTHPLQEDDLRCDGKRHG